MDARHVGIRELRLNLSRTIRAVERGETIEVTRNGESVARLVPATHATRLDRLIAEGKASPAKRPLDLTRPLREVTTGVTASEALDRLRGD